MRGHQVQVLRNSLGLRVEMHRRVILCHGGHHGLPLGVHLLHVAVQRSLGLRGQLCLCRKCEGERKRKGEDVFHRVVDWHTKKTRATPHALPASYFALCAK